MVDPHVHEHLGWENRAELETKVLLGRWWTELGRRFDSGSSSYVTINQAQLGPSHSPKPREAQLGSRPRRQTSQDGDAVTHSNQPHWVIQAGLHHHLGNRQLVVGWTPRTWWKEHFQKMTLAAGAPLMAERKNQVKRSWWWTPSYRSL